MKTYKVGEILLTGILKRDEEEREKDSDWKRDRETEWY